MDIEDLIKNKHRYHDEHHHKDLNNRHGHYNDNGDHNYHRGHHQGHYKLEMIRSICQALPHKKALLTGVLIFGVLILVIGIALLWSIFPLLTNAVEYVEANGIKSIVDAIMQNADKLWKGNG
jgi:hypothetical protein